MYNRALRYFLYVSLMGMGGLAIANKTGFKVYPPDGEQRILLEKKGSSTLMLVGSRFALVDGSLQELEKPAEWQGGELKTAPKPLALAPVPKPIKIEGRTPFCSKERPVRKIFLDPGHGGTDLGASLGSLHEKDITLQFAQEIAKELQASGFEVLLSRTHDVFLPLDVRPQLAKKWDADLFVSIHMNSSPSRTAHGTETYILSAEATDAEARKLAVKENSILKQFPQKGGDTISSILWDMEQTVYLQESAYLASQLQQSVIAAAHSLVQGKSLSTEWKNRGVRQAPFFVLSRATMPAVLVEIGYLTHPRDRVYLLSKNFQQNLAKAVARGVKMYEENCKSH